MYNTVLFGIKNGVSNFASDVVFIVLFSVLTLATVFAAAWLINLSIKRKSDKPRANQLFGIMIIVAVVGVAIRIMLSFLIVGHRNEYDAIAGSNGIVWKIINEGFSGYYSATEEGALYPLALYLYSLMATLGSWFGMTASSAAMPFLIKLPLILADLGAAIMLYKIGKRYFNHVTAVVLGGLYSVCPVFFFASSVWGSLYAILAFFLLMAFYYLVQKKFLQMFAFYSLALLTAREAVYLFPVLGVYIVYQYIKAIKLEKKERATNRLTLSQLFVSQDRGLIIRLPLYFVMCLVGMYIISLPFIITDYSANFFVWLNEFYLKGLAKVEYYGYNSLSLYNIFGMNGDMFGTNLIALFVVLFTLIIIALTLIYYLSKKNRANLVMLAAFVYMTLSIFYIDFREMTSLPILALMLLSFIFIKDKRILVSFAMFAVIFVVNASVVMAYGGYLNNLSEAAFSASEYTNISPLLTSTAGKAISITFSVLALISYLYFTFVIMDISMNHNRKLFQGQDKISPLYAIKHWIVK